MRKTLEHYMQNIMEKRIKILLVEDNPGDADLAKEAFANGEFDVELTVAKDGEAAIRFLEHQGEFIHVAIPDIIILDLNLPRLNGLEVLEKIKHDERFMRIPVVILSSSDSAEDIRKSYESYANCYIRKPFDYRNYESVVRSIEDFWMNTAQLPPKDSD